VSAFVFFTQRVAWGDAAVSSVILSASLAFTIADIIVNGASHTLPTILRNMMQVGMLGWIIIVQPNEPMLVQNLYWCYLVILETRVFDAAHTLAGELGLTAIESLAYYAVRWMLVLSIFYLTFLFYPASTVPSFIAITYSLTDAVLFVIDGYLSTQ
jgi:hypothetical protein